MTTFPSDTHYQLLINAQRELDQILPLLEKAEACGMDCQEFRQGHAAMSGQIGAWLRNFFPDKLNPPTGTGISTHVG